MAQNVKLLNGLAIASVKTFRGLAIASVKTISGVDNAASSSYLLEENFEGTGTPSGWSALGAADPDYTGVVLSGSQSARSGNSTSDYFYYAYGSSKVEIWGKMLYRRQTALPASYTKIVSIRDTSTATAIEIGLGSGGGVYVDSGSIYQTTSDTMSADTTYYVWYHYKKGTGANAVGEVWWNTTDTRPTTGGTKYAGASNGNRTINADDLLTYNPGSSGWNIIDNFQQAETEFT